MVVVGLLVLRSYLHRPAGGDAKEIVTVASGTTLRPVLSKLAELQILARPSWLYLYARVSGHTEVRSGEYELKAQQTPLQILLVLEEGRVRTEQVTIPEGLNRWQVSELLAAKGWMEPATFDKLCDDQGLLAKHKIPGPSCDGYLFPETYTFARGVSPTLIFAALFEAFGRMLAEVRQRGSGPLGLSSRELTTLASIVEKETGAPSERPHIACVFYNRLQAKTPWKLQTDPTVIYAARLLDSSFDGNLTREHLRRMESPYNTYKVFGLPPGPIANPGRAALAAVCQPVTCNDYFFVSKNDGTHEFCATLKCHNLAVQKWQVDYFSREKPKQVP